MSATLQTMRSGGSQHPEEIMNFHTSRTVKGTGGVFDKDNDSFLVSEEAVPAMSVLVNEGYAFLRKSGDDMVYPVRLYDGDDSVAISSNSSGNDRIDAIVLYIDLGASANADITNVAKLTVVEGTPAGSPSAPSDGDIETAIGASNPYLRIADVAVDNGAVSILDADITDQRSEVLFISNGAPVADGDVANKAYVDAEVASVDAEVASGWTAIIGTWTASDANSISINADLTSLLQKGTKLKLTNNSAVKYFYITTTPAFGAGVTTFDVTGETDLVAGAITLPYYSYADCPQGFKRGEDWFNCVGTLGADQTISDATATTLDFEATTDTNSNFNNTTNKYTCPVSGMYIVQMSIREGSGSPDWTRALTYIYAPTAIPGNDIQATEVRGITHCELVRCDKGDEIYCRLLVDADSGNPIVGSNSSFAISFIGL